MNNPVIEELQGKVAIVTGAAGGVGAAVARLFAERGAFVVAQDIKPAVGALEEENERIVTLVGDVADEATARRSVQLAKERFGRLDVLVNNAARIINRNVVEMSLADWDAIMNVNVRGAFLHAREALRVMIDQGSGSIINVGSYACQVAFPSIAAYAASKGALAQLTRVLALEGAPHGIRANVVAPGDVETGILDELMPDGRAFLREHGAQSPLGRVAQPEEIAEFIAFVASERASYITGSVLLADGGYTAV
ncbi:NAD(P)-dependent dehydrogenase, short-chain alcohol dehydrogenase family [Azotobacter beijerinckii]|uniref:NAD(P)-dependent dehydrogenase, short-chain alcohol dehydrogenase family n=1 Tax=Azotobacter beijerinckii TaxID=170623 RepID=A0A1H6YF60_9GAMM|nr:SDR family oxidoreductase [Azotobacter beijerinckii]SEJ35830.1 NAD(P)-dependent dehydrogenase, short-chain alcohol dehydrogenase family [Azotobacter beijerinckii]SEJ49096.1 NAD(P)-dependent dehydrogenase, short-chain alcohol dehydrogenase family [Azotobacter beijerinckii]